jgi:hypothetical protein
MVKSGEEIGLRDSALRAWLRSEVGLAEYRRVVREGDSAIVISKFEPGFSQDLFATVDLLPELFDAGVVGAEYERLAEAHQALGEAPMRTAVWREASEAELNRLCAQRGIDEQRLMFVLPGIESVQAVMDSILWTAPLVGGDYEPAAGEVEAFREFQDAQDERSLFTRYYGELDGKRVENYCPGAPFGRRLVAQAWAICTGR